ncbi:probable tRNA(His) guanylyltransferase [Hydra vulgaris]|uniref:tRNA(His) guanylyltransferase n=1 Tax=Hydra vulgaris TaxID=6087 RepID=T2M4Y4_HYDVU
MAKSKYEYVKKFEQNETCLLNCWIVVRIDGRGFHKFTHDHLYEKPNDIRGLSLMNFCAKEVMKQFQDIVISYGQSDEYSFVFSKNTSQFKRRSCKLMSNIVSLFSSSFVFYWKTFFLNDLIYPPQFDGRIILYPSLENIRDYLSWRQADCHINNLYNTCFWSLVNKGGLSTLDAELKLKGTLAKDKNELLFSEFDVNYNDISPIFRKGNIVIRQKVAEEIMKEKNGESVKVIKEKNDTVILHDDIIGENFWKKFPEILT